MSEQATAQVPEEQESKSIDDLKAQAKTKSGEKREVDINNLTFQKSSGSGIVYMILEKAKKPLTLKEVTERAVEAGLKNPDRAKTVANWFVSNGVATKDPKGCYKLIPKAVPAPA